jgi:hypothetical protein
MLHFLKIPQKTRSNSIETKNNGVAFCQSEPFNLAVMSCLLFDNEWRT